MHGSSTLAPLSTVGWIHEFHARCDLIRQRGCGRFSATNITRGASWPLSSPYRERSKPWCRRDVAMMRILAASLMKWLTKKLVSAYTRLNPLPAIDSVALLLPHLHHDVPLKLRQFAQALISLADRFRPVHRLFEGIFGLVHWHQLSDLLAPAGQHDFLAFSTSASRRVR